MGCDIHVFTEVKIQGTWYTYGHPMVPRNYALFELMANVRGGGWLKPISGPKGLPPDVSVVARIEADYDAGHSHSYLTFAEIRKFTKIWERWVEKAYGDQGGWTYDVENMFGYLFGNAWADFTKDHSSGVQDVRWVFWFDS